ncbi:hypothetical protein A4G20_02130 [Pasteurellaceae bacterium RH1A]|nr:hypothetical protein A4G20_02130 [Pasteurellaceae bacterium RH1A]
MAWQAELGDLSACHQAWLLCEGSLTEKLQQVCTHLQVEVIQEGWLAKNPAFSTACWQRDVLLKCGSTPWIFAQTILPAQTVEQVAQAVLSLGDKPIGLWLFPQKPQRLSLEWGWDAQTGLYARRSTLDLKGYPLEISELFLPAFIFAG